MSLLVKKGRSPRARSERPYSVATGSPPPSFSTGSPPPSFKSSPPASTINGDDRSSLEILSVPPKATLMKHQKVYGAEHLHTRGKAISHVKGNGDFKGGEGLGEKSGLKAIYESDGISPPPSYTSNHPQPQKWKKICCLGSVMVCCAFFVLLAIIVPVAIVVGKSESHGSPTANTTTTVTVGSTLTRVSSLTVTTTVATTFTTPARPTSTTPAVIPIPTVLGGFDALEFGDQTMWMFYADQGKNIKQIQASADTYYRRSYWTPGYPDIVSTGVKAGSPVQVIGTRNRSTGIRSDIHLFFVGEDAMIKEMTTSASTGSVSSYPINWRVGSLSALRIEVSNAMLLRVCTPWATSQDYNSTAADLYIYYSSKNGGLKKLGWWKAQPSTWVALNDTPQITSHGSVECQNDYGNTENIWIVNENKQLEQWTHNSTDRSSTFSNGSSQAIAKREVPTAANWTRALVYSLKSVHPQTNILSITSTLQTLGGRTHIFYQDSNNTIRRLDVNGIGDNAWVQTDEIVDQGTPGTRLTTTNSSSTYCGYSAGVTIYYQRNTSEIMYYTFTDLYATGGMAKTVYYGSPLYASIIVETYGLPRGGHSNPDYGSGSGGGSMHYSGWHFLAIAIALLCACYGCCS